LLSVVFDIFSTAQQPLVNFHFPLSIRIMLVSTVFSVSFFFPSFSFQFSSCLANLICFDYEQ